MDEAVAEYEAGIELGERTPDAFAGLGDTLAFLANGGSKKGKKAVVAPAVAKDARMRATEAYKQALDLDPYHAPALYGRALTLAALHE